MKKVLIGLVAALVMAKPSVRDLDAQFNDIMKRVNYPHSAFDSKLAHQTLLEINSFHFNSERPQKQLRRAPAKVQAQVFLPDLPEVTDDEVESFIETRAQTQTEKATPIRAPAMYNHPAPPKARQPLPPQATFQLPQAPQMPQFAQYGQYQQQQQQQYPQQMQFVQQPQMQYAQQPQQQQQYLQQPYLQQQQQYLPPQQQQQPMYQQMAFQQPAPVLPLQSMQGQGMYPGQMDASGAMRFRQEQRFPEFKSQVSVLPNTNGAPAYGFATNTGFQPIQSQITRQDMQFSQQVRANNHAEPVVPDLPPPPVIAA